MDVEQVLTPEDREAIRQLANLWKCTETRVVERVYEETAMRDVCKLEKEKKDGQRN